MASIEDFFLARYEQVEKENAELKEKIKELQNSDKYGVFVTNKDTEAVKVEMASAYYIFESTYSRSKIADWDADRLKQLLGAAPSKYADLGLITREDTTFVADIEFRLVGKSYTKSVRPNKDVLEDVYTIECIKADGALDYLGSWCRKDCVDYLMSKARDVVQDAIVKQIEKLEGGDE